MIQHTIRAIKTRKKSVICSIACFGVLVSTALFVDRRPSFPGQAEKTSKEHRLPDVLIVGFRKSGTTAVLTYLLHHPQIAGADKELNFFSRTKLFKKGLDYYKTSLLPPARPGQLVLEKSPTYAGISQAASRIKATLGSNVRLIFVVRNPVDRLISDFVHSRQTMPRRYQRGFSETVFNLTGKSINAHWSIFKPGYYAEHLGRYLDLGYSLDRDILIVDGENLVKNPADEMALVQQFLNIPSFINHSSFYFNKDKGFSCLNVTNLGWHSLNYLQEDGCFDKDKGRVHPKLTKTERFALIDFYAPRNEKFFELIGRKFSWNN